jgi:hypothetical protein
LSVAVTDVNLNAVQTVFALFFAISWGTAANAQPKWKAFAWGQVREPKTIRRLSLSFALLNILPVVFFVAVLQLLGGPQWTITAWNLKADMRICAAVVPAVGTFGFLRIWTSVVQWKTAWFYPDRKHFKALGIDIDSSDLSPKWAAWNFFFGLSYVLVGLMVPWLGPDFFSQLLRLGSCL